MRRAVLALLALSLLTACETTESLDTLRAATPVGDAYSTALATSYRGIAEKESAQMEWALSSHYADKGLMAAYGAAVEPDTLEDATLTEEQDNAFTEARAKLMEAIAANRETQPALAADATVAFDRWLEAAQGINGTSATAREQAFTAALGKLTVVQAADPATKPPSTAPVTSTSTILYFPFDDDALGDTARAAVDEMVGFIHKAGKVNVSINGHTDRAGTDEYNQALSERRAISVLKAFEKAGVPDKIMKYFAFGETDPAVATADGVREPKNRRVEIFFEAQ